ncbi:hypothetical protein [Bradyrhizobium sp. RDM4]|uniref:hypothetical protein n=1 Tax=Bradyrhizobium sp. RDM4 TaxID=3378765 RepID=UPI0038FC256C
MSDTNIDFTAPASLRKWPSINNERVPKAWGGVPYLIRNGTLDECMREFMAKPEAQRHLYEIHTRPQPPWVTEVLQRDHLVELSRLRDFL